MRKAVLLATLLTSPALGYTYELKPIALQIAGASNIDLSFMSQAGDFCGYYTVSGQEYAFYRYRGRDHTLPPPPKGTENRVDPSSITFDGHVAGTYYFGNAYGFVFYRGRYVAAGIFTPGVLGNAGLNDRGDLYINSDIGDGITEAQYGTIRHQRQFGNSENFISSMNSFGDLGGTESAGIGYVYIHHKRNYLFRSESQYTTDVRVNDARQIAGYTVANNEAYLFLITGKRVEEVQFPNFGNGSVDALNDAGAIAGTYLDGTGNEVVYVFKNHAFRTVASFPLLNQNAPATVVGLTENGTVALAVKTSGGYQSYLAVCHGAGC